MGSATPMSRCCTTRRHRRRRRLRRIGPRRHGPCPEVQKQPGHRQTDRHELEHRSGHPLLANQGDFDGDGDIDGNDLLIWQNNFPRTDGAAISFIGDATGDGNVDGDDFLIWQNSFPYPAVLSKTPEPASLGLLALGALLMLRRRRSMKTTPTFHESSRPCPRRKHS